METKRSIAEYLKLGVEGPYFHRTVETVLCRDKNWVRWKIESCPSIERPAITPAEHNSAKSAARKATINKKFRAKPLGSLDLGFLTEADGARGMDKLKDASRHQLPTLDSFKNRIALDEMEIEMPTSDETREAAINSKASKNWRALRIASRIKLATFDKIEDPEKIDIIFQEDPVRPRSMKENGVDSIDVAGIHFPVDRRAIIITGSFGVGNDALVDMLIDRHPKVFAKTISHTTRLPHKNELDGVHYYFIANDQFNIMRDGDQFLGYYNVNGDDYGTGHKTVEGIVTSGRIPVIEVPYNVSFMHNSSSIRRQISLSYFIYSYLEDSVLMCLIGCPTNQGPWLSSSSYLFGVNKRGSGTIAHQFGRSVSNRAGTRRGGSRTAGNLGPIRQGHY
jgi:THO complex subunit 1